ncbi:hypothetical protein [Streptomyces sp. CB03238]|uniref:hypothetical protein n=1 Tax=Streptomyces sp. CB03238 TaxID=1907777 RepID=UPI000A1051E3|nr:hypothetical protein [Streptomyces sp. CB03238]ORT61050.1 hypothetical protein BKD26_02910 [Streptomyces sp. CB03238]
MVARRPIALTAGIVLVLEAVGLVLLHMVLAKVMGGQRMSLDGLDPDLMVTAIWVMGGVFGAYVALCGALLVRLGVRDRALGRAARIVLIACAITHGVLGAVTVGLVGWAAFAYMTVVLGLIVASLTLYAPEGEEPPAPPVEGGVAAA